MYLIRLIRSFFIKKPNRKLTWTVNDFTWGKKWAKTQPHPNAKNKTLWDAVYNKSYDSTEVLHEINKRL
jgi:hypothetical protein